MMEMSVARIVERRGRIQNGKYGIVDTLKAMVLNRDTQPYKYISDGKMEIPVIGTNNETLKTIYINFDKSNNVTSVIR